MKKKVLLSVIMSVVTLVVMADEYIDPQTHVVYTYQPGQATASVKAGYNEVIDRGPGYESDIVYHPGSPDAAGDVAILDRFTVGAFEYVVTSIGERAFRENKNIKSVSIPETMTNIGGAAFAACSNLTSVSIPETVTNIGGSAFADCNNLTEIRLPEGLTRLTDNLFLHCRQLVSVTIPSSVSIIDRSAFCGCSSLVSLDLPAGLSFVGRQAFYGTPWYTALYDEAPDGPFYIGSQLFGYKGDKPVGELVIKEGTRCVCYGAFANCDGLTSVVVPGSVAYIDEDAFSNCNHLTGVYITDLAAWCGIEFQAEFHSSSNPLSKAHHLYINGKEVTDLVIPEGVTNISKFAFDYCTSLNSVTLSEGITTVGACAFRGCENLASVTIPSSLATIGDDAFKLCKKLDAVHISDLSAWCRIPFFWSANPLWFGAHLYLNGEEVSDLVIPEGVTDILDGAFFNFKYLRSVIIPEGVSSIGENAFNGCSLLSSVTFPKSLKSISMFAFNGCSSLMGANIPEGVTSIGQAAFYGCSALKSVTIPSTVQFVDVDAFYDCWALSSVISWIEEPFEISNQVFRRLNRETYESSYTSATLYVPKGCKARYESTAGWNIFPRIIENDYRPFVEDGKVWKVGGKDAGNPVKFVAYYYFDGDTIIGGKTFKQMMCQRYFNPDCPKGFYYDYWAQLPSLSKVGAWYEEDKKVYVCREGTQGMEMLYDFSLEANDTLILNVYQPYYIVGPKQTGELKGFKGVYRDIMLCGGDNYITTWLEGVGGIDGPLRNVYPENESDPQFLLSCSVGDEVIYLNDDYEDGATPEGSRKDRFDFTHTIKTNPKAPFKRENSDACISSSEREVAQSEVKVPRRSDEAQSLYGEYNDLLLGIHLDPLDDAYLVSITNESGQVVYEKTVNAGTIVGLSIDISAYAKGRYTVTVENSRESFTGEFEVLTTGISDAARLNNNEQITKNKLIYNLQGQRLSSLQKGLNIVNGKKVYVK